LPSNSENLAVEVTQNSCYVMMGVLNWGAAISPRDGLIPVMPAVNRKHGQRCSECFACRISDSETENTR